MGESCCRQKEIVTKQSPPLQCAIHISKVEADSEKSWEIMRDNIEKASTDTTMVSVIVLTYNHKMYIRQALDSVLMQDVDFRYEILIGDDASTDHTGNIVREYAFRYPNIIRMFQRERNVGATKNLYDLQEKAVGRYLAYLEGDDYWIDRTKLKKQVSFLEDEPSYIGCTHACMLVDENGRELSRKEPDWIFQKRHYTLRDFKGIVLPGHINSMVHRNIFKNSNGTYGPLITVHPLIGDRTLCLLLASQGNIFRFNAVMGCYRVQRQKTGKNATMLAYGNNQNWIRDDYLYTVVLENYANKVLKVDGRFIYHKQDLFVSGLWEFIQHPTKENRMLIKQILGNGPRWRYFSFLPIGVIKKLIKKLKW